MSQFDKLIKKIKDLDKDLRFDELRKIMEYFGYTMKGPNGGSSHKTFRKPGVPPITIPQHEPINKTYVEMVKEIIESEEDKDDR